MSMKHVNSATGSLVIHPAYTFPGTHFASPQGHTEIRVPLPPRTQPRPTDGGTVTVGIRRRHTGPRLWRYRTGPGPGWNGGYPPARRERPTYWSLAYWTVLPD